MKKLIVIGFVLAIAGCGGGASDTTIVTPQAKISTVRVPSDLSQVTYPNSYTQEHQTVLTVDPCQLDYSTVDYPKEWLGKYQLPNISGAPLRSDILRAVWLKDIHLPNNPSINLGCSGSLYNEFAKTVSRLKKLNVDYVMVPQWHWLTTNTDGSWTVLSAEQSSEYALKDKDLEYLVKLIHSSGLKVMMVNTVQGMLNRQDASGFVPEKNLNNYKQWLNAYKNFMYERAIYFQSIGIDLWETGCNNCIFSDHGDHHASTQELFYQTYHTVLTNITKVYKNKLLVHYTDWLNTYPDYLNQIEFVKVGHYGVKLTQTEMDNLNVDNYKKILLRDSNIPLQVENLKKFNKKIIFEFGIQSRADAFLNPGYMEETSCTAFMGSMVTSTTTCIQKNTKPDFSLQAIVVQSVLEILGSSNLPAGSMILILDYWQTDVIHPGVAFPNIGSSIRNKPAEGVVKSWFQRG